MGKGDKLSIELVGGPPWGFRLGGGSDFGCPLEIAKLRKKSKASEAGLEEGDVVTSIDQQDVSRKSHGDAMKIIEVAGSTLRLDIVKGVGPSANPLASAAMDSSLIINQSDGLTMTKAQQPVGAMVVRSREPSVNRSFIEPSRERSVSKTIVISSAPQKAVEVHGNSKPAEPWTVDVTSYEFANSPPMSASSRPNPPTLTQPTPQPKQAPPTSPKPSFKASTLPRMSAPATATLLTSNKNAGGPHAGPQSRSVPGPSAAATPPIFKVSKIDANMNQAKWQPTSIKSVDYNHPRHNFNSEAPGMNPSPQFPVAYPPSAVNQEKGSVVNPAMFSPKPTAPQPMIQPPAVASPPRTANHIPGMVNPLICDDSQGDFGANPPIRPDKKIYSDSTFYDSPGMGYPTIHEQVALCKEIANFLESNQNKRSRGGKMFMRRKQKSDQWSMDGQGQRRDAPSTHNYDLLGMENMKAPGRPTLRREFVYNTVRHHPDPIKSKLNAAELEHIQHDQEALCKHDSLPPNLAFDINQALSHSRGKAGQIFEKRRQRAEKYVVDENQVRNTQYNRPATVEVPDRFNAHSYVSPWQAAMAGRLDMGFQPNSQPSPNHKPLHIITSQPSAQQAQLNVKYKSFKPVQAPAGTESGYQMSGMNGSQTLPRSKTRLEQMIAGGNNSMTRPLNNMAAPMNSSDMMHTSFDGSFGYNSQNNFAQPPAPTAAAYTRLSQHPASNFTLNLRRPKDYVSRGNVMTQSSHSALSAF